VGSTETTTPDPALIEANTGAGWSAVAAPSPEPVNTLQAITCVDSNDCWAVGHTGDETLIERYASGSWTYVSSPNPPSEPQPELTGVSCVSLDDCWAVGWGQPSGSQGYQTLIEHYTGSAWTIVASPNSSDASSNILNGIACATASECWAVGGAQSTGPLIEQYNGSSWSVDTNVAASGPASSLNAVTCDAGDSCWAVGVHDTTNDSETQSLIEHFDGTGWTPVSSPNPIGGATGENYLYGVTCDTGNECWAVGHSDYFVGADYGWSLIERYTASTGWTTDGPDPSLSGEAFFGVACGALECTAVGENAVDIEPVIAQSPVTKASVGGGSSGTSGPPPSGGTASKGSAGPGVPDTGGAGAPWAPLLIGGGIVTVALARRLRHLPAAQQG
jgi:hypothetical protein